MQDFKFSENQIKGNTNICHLLMIKGKSPGIHIGEYIIKSSDGEKNMRH